MSGFQCTLVFRGILTNRRGSIPVSGWSVRGIRRNRRLLRLAHLLWVSLDPGVTCDEVRTASASARNFWFCVPLP